MQPAAVNASNGQGSASIGGAGEDESTPQHAPAGQNAPSESGVSGQIAPLTNGGNGETAPLAPAVNGDGPRLLA
jgi:hypothetical protein